MRLLLPASYFLLPNPIGGRVDVGLIGLGRMGANMAERLAAAGHRVVGYDVDAATRDRLAAAGRETAASLEALVAALSPPRCVWVMVPAGDATSATIDALVPFLRPGDLVVDGGNSFYKDSVARGVALAARGLAFVDVGVSGGIWGLAEGYSVMAGGDADAYARVLPLLQSLAPAPDRGLAHVGPTGAGHFVKMIHNGIEYGMMQALAEGFAILDAKREFDLDLGDVAEVWRHGSVVRSWLLDLAAAVLRRDGDLSDLRAWVSDSGEGRWTVAEAIELDIPAPVITLALQQRLRSRQSDPFAERLLAALRREFGGHAVQAAEESPS